METIIISTSIKTLEPEQNLSKKPDETNTNEEKNPIQKSFVGRITSTENGRH